MRGIAEADADLLATEELAYLEEGEDVLEELGYLEDLLRSVGVVGRHGEPYTSATRWFVSRVVSNTGKVSDPYCPTLLETRWTRRMVKASEFEFALHVSAAKCKVGLHVPPKSHFPVAAWCLHSEGIGSVEGSETQNWMADGFIVVDNPSPVSAQVGSGPAALSNNGSKWSVYVQQTLKIARK